MFIALIPVFAVIRNTSWKLVPIYGFFYGFVFYLFFNYWLKTFHPLAILLVPIIKGGEMILLFPVLKAAQQLFKKHGYLVEALVYVAYAYLSQDWFAGYPYGTLGSAVYRYLPFIQIAEFTGIWGVTFLMVLPQTFLASYLADWYRKRTVSFTGFLASHRPFLITYGVAIVATLVFGFVSIAHWKGVEPDAYWRVATIHTAPTPGKAATPPTSGTSTTSGR